MSEPITLTTETTQQQILLFPLLLPSTAQAFPDQGQNSFGIGTNDILPELCKP